MDSTSGLLFNKQTLLSGTFVALMSTDVGYQVLPPHPHTTNNPQKFTNLLKIQRLRCKSTTGAVRSKKLVKKYGKSSIVPEILDISDSDV